MKSLLSRLVAAAEAAKLCNHSRQYDSPMELLKTVRTVLGQLMFSRERGWRGREQLHYVCNSESPRC